MQQPDHPRRLSRASIACLQCRQRHLKCDGATPTCTRCHSIGSQCTYLKSRRGGRPRQHSLPQQMQDSPMSSQMAGGGSVGGGASSVAGTLQALSECDDVPVVEEHRNSTSSSATSWGAESTVTSNDDGIRSLPLCSFYIEPLLELYYDHFHGTHPCVLPPQFMKERISDSPPGMNLLLTVMRFIGSLYSPTIPSDPLNEEVKRAFAQSQPWTSGYEIQAYALYAIAAFWCDEGPLAKEMLDTAATKALAVGMNLREYAVENSGGDAVLAESWRRTWWQIYINDLHITATNHETRLRVSQRHTIATVDLPCEEDEYSAGNIPAPRTMEDYDHREFATDEDAGFSSYAYLIGLLRSLDLSIFGVSRHLESNVKNICMNTDESIAAWVSLLPKEKRRLFREDGSFDELLFKANSLMQVYTIDTHRQLSTLAYNPVESNSSCSPRPPPGRVDDVYYGEENVHTAKILAAIERMTNLLTLPTKVSLHTPFTICIVATITIAHLSACKYVLQGEALKTARERIRVAMGALETFAEVWPRGKRVVREVKIIARELLRLSPETAAGSAGPSGLSSGLSSGVPSGPPSAPAALDKTMENPNPYETTLRILNDKSSTVEADYFASLDSFCFVGEGLGENFDLQSFFPASSDAIMSTEHSMS